MANYKRTKRFFGHLGRGLIADAILNGRARRNNRLSPHTLHYAPPAIYGSGAYYTKRKQPRRKRRTRKPTYKRTTRKPKPVTKRRTWTDVLKRAAIIGFGAGAGRLAAGKAFPYAQKIWDKGGDAAGAAGGMLESATRPYRQQAQNKLNKYYGQASDKVAGRWKAIKDYYKPQNYPEDWQVRDYLYEMANYDPYNLT